LFLDKIKSDYWRSVLTVASGTLGSQIIFFILLPVITRIYQPEEYGKYTAIVGYAIVLSTVLSAGIERAIPLINTTSRRAFSATLFLYSIGFTLLLAIFLLVINSFFLFLEQFDIVFIPLIGLLFALINILTFIGISEEQFKLDAKVKVSQALFISIGQILIYFIVNNKVALLVADLFSKLAAVLMFKKNLNLKFNILASKLFITEIKNFKSFYTFGLASSVLVALSMNLPYILMAEVYGFDVAALVFLALKLTALPTSLIGTAIGKVYFAKASKIKDDKVAMRNLFFSNLKKLSLLSILIIPAFFIASYLIPYFLGNQWQDISQIIIALILLSMGQIIVNPLSLTATIYKKQHIDLFINLVRVLTVFLVFFGGIYFDFTYIEVLQVYSISMFCIYMINLFVSYNILKYKAVDRVVGF